LPTTGVAVLNADDERVAKFRNAYAGKVVTYGFSSSADVRATDVEIGAEGTWFTVRGERFQTSLRGQHNVSNILAGLAVASVFNIEFRKLAEHVAKLVPGEMRGGRRTWRGVTILDDCYNSNPEAARSMIDVLRDEPGERRIAVLGEMLELGQMSETLHREVGRYAADRGVDVLIGIHGASEAMIDEAQCAGLDQRTTFFFEEPEDAGLFLRDFVRTGDVVLFKGSRGTHVERALARMEA
jgi:UDP-N-acetylmuramoyl-tripeptide--D-alanyl-D-alanine ligase